MLKIFENLSAAERERAVACLGIRRKTVARGEMLFREGEAATSFGIVLRGSVNVVRYSVDGRARVLTHLTVGEPFGTSFALGGAQRYFANIEAAEETETLLVNGARVLAPCAVRCELHIRLLGHLVNILAARNVALARKIDCLSQHSTAEKLLAYLQWQAEVKGSYAFDIPFTRQELADYLNVDRAALSTEIGKLIRRGVLETTRKHFRLLNPAVATGARTMRGR